MFKFTHLVQGFDTVECAYYLMRADDCKINFTDLAVQKEISKIAKSKNGTVMQLGSEEFMLASHGTASGYPYLIENDAFVIQFGEFNMPNFFVKYRSIALWHHGVENLHKRFLAWAASVGMTPFKPEKLSRVDFAFDYQIPEIDFDEDNFLTSARKDNQHRKNGKIQTLKFGTDQIVLRIYNKTDEIEEVSHKTWLYKIWNTETNVWRIEWQVRKVFLKFLSIEGIADLIDIQGDLLRILVKDTTLRIKSSDTNRSRWALHPLWEDLTQRIEEMDGLGIVRSLDKNALLEERFTRIAISVLGYVKRVAAIDAIYKDAESEKSYMDEALQHLMNRVGELHDPLTWQMDVNRRIKEMKLGEW